MVSDDNRDIISLPVPPSVRLTMLFCDALMVAGCLAAIIVYSPYMSEAAAGMEDPPTLSLLHPVAVSFSAILLMVVCKWVLVCNETYRSFVSATLAISLAVIEIAAFLIFFLFAMMSIGVFVLLKAPASGHLYLVLVGFAWGTIEIGRLIAFTQRVSQPQVRVRNNILPTVEINNFTREHSSIDSKAQKNLSNTRFVLSETVYVPSRPNIHTYQHAHTATQESDIESGCVAEASGTACVICLSEFQHGDRVVELPCGQYTGNPTQEPHTYHTHCIRGWFTHSTTCCICRWKVASQAVTFDMLPANYALPAAVTPVTTLGDARVVEGGEHSGDLIRPQQQQLPALTPPALSEVDFTSDSEEDPRLARAMGMLGGLV